MAAEWVAGSAAAAAEAVGEGVDTVAMAAEVVWAAAGAADNSDLEGQVATELAVAAIAAARLPAAP